MNRRNFLKGAAAVAAASSMPLQGFSHSLQQSETPSNPEASQFRFNDKGKFRIMQLTDTHYIAGDARSERAMKNVCEMLDTEKPDLVIHTGDIIFGKPAKESFAEILLPMAKRRIPFAVALGNHDDEFGLSRMEAYNFIRTLPYNVNSPEKGIHGASNDVFTLQGKDGKTAWVLYLLDTGNRSKDIKIDSYDYLHFDQLQWYRNLSRSFTLQNGGTPVPSLAFMHIPVLEHVEALRDKSRMLKGNLGEEPCPSLINSGFFAQTQEMGDIQALFSGHEHDDDYVMKWRDKYLIYGRFSGCDTVYNNLRPSGCRMIELTEGEAGFRTWVRLYGGTVEQDLRIPQDFRKY